jgi:GntR family transcriptional regulator
MTEGLSIYQQLQNDLRKMIQEAPKGTKLPSEPDLAKDLGVSRATLREAMRTFESQGLLKRHQGLGTFVVGPTQVIDTGLEVLESIETQAKKSGLDVIMGEYDIEYIEADSQVAEKLNLSPGESLTKITRVILTNGSPSAYLIDIFPEDLINQTTLDAHFSGSILDLLLETGEPTLAISKTKISAVHAPVDVAKALHIQRGDTLLLLNGLLIDKDGNPLDISYSYFLPGYFRLHIIRKIGGVKAS